MENLLENKFDTLVSKNAETFLPLLLNLGRILLVPSTFGKQQLSSQTSRVSIPKRMGLPFSEGFVG